MIVLIVDTEGSPTTPCEIGAILYDTKTNEILQCESTLLPHEMTKKMAELDLLDPNETYLCRSVASNCVKPSDLQQAYDRINTMFLACELIIAHNASHDRRVVSGIVKLNTRNKPWMCTMRNITWPNYTFDKCPRLDEICGVQNVGYKDAHVALNDCDMLLSCLRTLTDLEQQVHQFVASKIGQKRKIDETLANRSAPCLECERSALVKRSANPATNQIMNTTNTETAANVEQLWMATMIGHGPKKQRRV
jgi:DNA polymerase III epsilon subunit-like protein